MFPHDVQENGLYEFYGKEGTGKTQALLHLIANCILPFDWLGYNIGGCGAGAVLLDTDYHFSMVRFAGILEHRIQAAIKTSEGLANQDLPTTEEIDALVKVSLKRLQYVFCNNSFKLLLTLHSLKSYLGSHPDICMLAIDSISAFYWQDRTDSKSTQETRMPQIAHIIKELQNMFNLTVFATKSALFEKKTRDNKSGIATANYDDTGFGIQESTCVKTDCAKLEHYEFLGTSWSKLVTKRLIFWRNIHSQNDIEYSVSSDVKLQSNSDRDSAHVTFVIGESGLDFSRH